MTRPSPSGPSGEGRVGRIEFPLDAPDAGRGALKRYPNGIGLKRRAPRAEAVSMSVLARLEWVRSVQELRARTIVARAIDGVRSVEERIETLQSAANGGFHHGRAEELQLQDTHRAAVVHHLDQARVRLVAAHQELDVARQEHLAADHRLRAAQHVRGVELDDERRVARRSEQNALDEIALLVRNR